MKGANCRRGFARGPSAWVQVTNARQLYTDVLDVKQSETLWLYDYLPASPTLMYARQIRHSWKI